MVLVLSDNLEFLIIWRLSGLMSAGLKELTLLASIQKWWPIVISY